MEQVVKNKLRNMSLRRKIVLLMASLGIGIPVLLVSIFLNAYYNLGVKSLFSEKMNEVVLDTVEIAKLYLSEHKNNIRADILLIAKELDKNNNLFSKDPGALEDFLNRQADQLFLSEIMLFSPERIIAKNSLSFGLHFEYMPYDALLRADTGEIVILGTDTNKVRAVMRWNKFLNAYLLVGRAIDPNILKRLHKTEGSVHQYQAIMKEIKERQTRLQAIFLVASLLLCGGSIAIGMRLARVITKPVNLLLDATSKVSDGNFEIRVPEKKSNDEVSKLTRSFNKMTETLARQRQELIEVNNIIAARRNFIEFVLGEISAGVVVLDSNKKISLCNKFAQQIFNIDHITDITSMHINSLMPEFKPLFDNTEKEIQVTLNKFQNTCHIIAKISTKVLIDKEMYGFIITFTDITDLIHAQKMSAWADASKRVAHEIKNPLTPISLSAEMLQKKYAHMIVEDEEHFFRYIDTIIKQVSSLRRIVEDFTDYGNKAQSIIKKEDIISIIKDIIFSESSIHSKNVEYVLDSDEEAVYCWLDRTRIAQVLTNLLRNSAEALSDGGCVSIEVSGGADGVSVVVSDDGPGFDVSILDRLCDPYVTTKKGGRGLGLTVVKRIIADHDGIIHFTNRTKGRGTSVSFTIPYNKYKKRG